MLEKVFHLKQNKTNTKTEIVAGITTFMAMAYILAVNPSILSSAGMDPQASLGATAIAAVVGSLIMGFYANYPIALAPALGLNAFFAYTVCVAMSHSWQFALLCVFVEGILFIILSLTKVREMLFDCIPDTLKHGITAGIGIFVAFVGLQNCHMVVKDDTTLVKFVSIGSDLSTAGICAILAFLGLILIVILEYKKVKGAILIGIIAVWILGIGAQLIGIYEGPSLLPQFSDFNPFAFVNNFGACFSAEAFQDFNMFDFVVVVFSLLLVNMFDCLGTLIGCAEKSGLLTKEGKLPRINKALLADSVAAAAGALVGTSTTSVYIESASGISVGGRTGLTAVTTAGLFLLSIFLSPLFIAIPGFATAPALIYVAYLMAESITKIEFKKITEALPALLIVIVMPLAYSITTGIAIGLIAYVLINLILGKGKQIHPLLYVISALFVVYYAIS